MNYSQEVLNKILEISKRDRSNLFEAAATVCEESDIDPMEFIMNLDKNVIEQLKYHALEGNHVRKCVHKKPKNLFDI